MFSGHRILFSALCCALLCACGQKGILVLPPSSASAPRATLPETLLPSGLTAPDESSAPARR
ncbi:MAG: hypothetical protein EBU07_04330 [Betaproteobacteria bacterium]|jgi:predicted small lipoprotein YifL|nr:hypothetical protein [Betaproteobacteria bacterium]